MKIMKERLNHLAESLETYTKHAIQQMSKIDPDSKRHFLKGLFEVVDKQFNLVYLLVSNYIDVREYGKIRMDS